jgi:hypothetical protein
MVKLRPNWTVQLHEEKVYILIGLIGINGKRMLVDSAQSIVTGLPSWRNTHVEFQRSDQKSMQHVCT